LINEDAMTVSPRVRFEFGCIPGLGDSIAPVAEGYAWRAPPLRWNPTLKQPYS
jgi:hypothetical protein